jgi:hypothetical protein
MESENLSKLTVAELLKKEKDSKSVLSYSTAVLIISPILMIGLSIQKQYTSVGFTALMCLLLPSFLVSNSKKQLRDIQAELEKRENGEAI